jgi:hypothetical protein
MIVWLASYPRSGNTFFRIVLNRLYGVRTYSVYNDRIFEERGSATTDVVGHVHTDLSIDELAGLPQTYFLKTHELPRDDAFPTIYLVRDGRDTLVSYAHFILHFEGGAGSPTGDFATVLHDLIEYRGSFGGWGPHVLGWRERGGRAATSFVRFEDLIHNPPEVLSRSLGAVQPDLKQLANPGSIPRFGQLQTLLPEFFRRGLAGGFRTEMSDDLQRLFWRHYGQAMLALGYTELRPSLHKGYPRFAASTARA